jgi:glutamate-ammonia-ligase adenylyltransferase
VLDQNTELALAKLLQAQVITLDDADILLPAATLYHTLTQVLRLCLDKPFVPDEAPRALKDLLARASEMPDFPSLEETLKETLGAVRHAFDRIVSG